MQMMFTGSDRAKLGVEHPVTKVMFYITSRTLTELTCMGRPANI